jgi:hypothetical protein
MILPGHARLDVIQNGNFVGGASRARESGTRRRAPPTVFMLILSLRSSEQSDAIVRSNHLLRTFARLYLEEIAGVGEPLCPAKN